MLIKLPWVEAIDTERMPDDFEDRVKESFKKFTECTSKAYTFEDKLLYLDNLRRYYLRGGRDKTTESYVRDLMIGYFEDSLDYRDEIPEKEAYLAIEFMGMCFEHGFFPFRDQYDLNSSSRNEQVLKVVLEIIRIIVNWEHEQA